MKRVEHPRINQAVDSDSLTAGDFMNTDEVIPKPFSGRLPRVPSGIPTRIIDRHPIQEPTQASLSSPDYRPFYYGDSSDDYMGKDFLKRCYQCRKEFGKKANIFMYMDRSFCSEKCRNHEIRKDDEELKKLQQEKK